jgi:hypothetical protein
MGKGPCTFKEADVTRAIRAAKKAGVAVAGFTVDPDGKITVQIGKPVDEEKPTGKGEWDNIQR